MSREKACARSSLQEEEAYKKQPARNLQSLSSKSSIFQRAALRPQLSGKKIFSPESMGSFSLAAIFCSEFIGMMLTIFMGEGILANELLQSTKGHGLGFFGVAFGFGLAFGVNIAWFGGISAHLNPGMFMFLAVQGKLAQGWGEFAVGTVADFLGAFAGAVLVWLFFLPHFGEGMPLPPDRNAVATLVFGPSSLDENAGRFASAFGDASRKPTEAVLQERQDRHARLHPNDRGRRSDQPLFSRGIYTDEEREALIDRMEMHHDRRLRLEAAFLQPSPSSVSPQSDHPDDDGASDPLLRQGTTMSGSEASNFNHEATNTAHNKGKINMVSSVTVKALHHPMSTELSASMVDKSPSTLGNDVHGEDQFRHSAQVAALLHMHDNGNDENEKEKREVEQVLEGHNNTTVLDDTEAPPVVNGDEQRNDAVKQVNFQLTSAQEKELSKRREAYEAFLKADSASKLSIFATRPAIFDLRYNFFQEALASAMLFFGAEMFNLATEMQAEGIGESLFTPVPLLSALWTSLFITMLILGLGGVTGLAVNPARDIGPRMAHFLLPFPNKGPSEWNYGLVVPLIAPYAGALLGAGMYQAMVTLYKTGGEL